MIHRPSSTKSSLKQRLEKEHNEALLKKDSNQLFPVINGIFVHFDPPRWPFECQVSEDNIRHIHYVPGKPEPFYASTGNEDQPVTLGEKRGTVVYDYPLNTLRFFHRSSAHGNQQIYPETFPSVKKDSLRFESRFESGNLAKAIRVHEGHYELYLRNDLYTNKHAQWFYFKITNMKRQMTYRFSIANMCREESLYTSGLKPLMYSVKNAAINKIGWRRCGSNISYYCSKNEVTETDSEINFALTFTIEFPYDADIVFLAYSYPYTYSDLQLYLIRLLRHPKKSQFSTVKVLCKTLARNNVYSITITSPEDKRSWKRVLSKRKKHLKKKKVIILTARVHPCESPSSWIMKGIIDFLTNNSAIAKELREKFIFKLVPMLNPDGVVVGNSRCSLSGKDLNRQFKKTDRTLFPSIWYTKLLIQRELKKNNVSMYCDFHAHSRSHNIFLYGCENEEDDSAKIEDQLFSMMLHKNATNKFSFSNCQFGCFSKMKEGTGRVIVGKMGADSSFTLEASFGGSRLGSRASTLFTIQDYESMGHSFCKTLLNYFNDDPKNIKTRDKLKQEIMIRNSNEAEIEMPNDDYVMIPQFTIANLTKPQSLYQKGLRPLLYSVMDESLQGVGWRRCGDNITYFPNKKDDRDVQTFSLSFTVEFPYDDDTVFMAYCYPYTYTDLQEYLSVICTHPLKVTYTTLEILCQTLAGNNVYCLTIASPQNKSLQDRKVIIITARVHPSETPSSWIMKGIIDFLTETSTTATKLREKFTFFLVPMLNPDGVIVGNTRLCLEGTDLNRQYKCEKSHTIVCLKCLVEQLLSECEVVLYCDLHAHSNRNNVFIFGCNSANWEDNFAIQKFPLFLHRNSPSLFSFRCCKFNTEKSKEGTARVEMWMQGITNSYTMEASVAGTLLGNRAGTHFTVDDYEHMGHCFCKTISDYYEMPTLEYKYTTFKEVLFLAGAILIICITVTVLVLTRK